LCKSDGRYRRIPWENNIAFFLVDFLNSETLEPLAFCPRNLLKSVVAKALALTAAEANAGVEFEWYNYLGTNRFELLAKYEYQKRPSRWLERISWICSP
jgi:glutamine synthetase